MASENKLVHILKSYVLKSVVIGFAILLVVLVLWLLRGFQEGAYWNAKRARSRGDIDEAVMLFKEAIYEDTRLSFKGLLALMEMNELSALEELIVLIDLSELNWIVAEDRERMCDVIRQRTAGTTADKLPLKPYAPQEIRAQQKREWQAWLVKAKQEYDWKDGKFVPKQQE